MQGYSQAEARRFAEQASDTLSKDPRIRLVYLFGSAVDPDVKQVRDVDLAILAEPALELEDLVRLRSQLGSTVGADVDLVSLNDASVVLAKEVADRGVCLYAQSPDTEVDFIVRARARYWDFKPFLDVQWKNTGSRLEERLRGTSS